MVDTVAVTGLEVPVGLALSNDGRLAIADYGAGTVVEVQIDTGGEVSAPRVLAEGLESPWGVAWGGNGEIFVAELDGARISKIGSDGTLSVYAGDTNGESSDPSTLSAFSAPVEVVPSDDGMLILDIGPGTIHWNDYREGTVSKLSGERDVSEPEDGALDFASWGEHRGRSHWMEIHGWSLTAIPGDNSPLETRCDRWKSQYRGWVATTKWRTAGWCKGPTLKGGNRLSCCVGYC